MDDVGKRKSNAGNPGMAWLAELGAYPIRPDARMRRAGDARATRETHHR